MKPKKKFLGLVGPQVTLLGQTARPQPPIGLAYIFNAAAKAGWQPILFDSLAEGYEHFLENTELGIRVTGLAADEVVKKIMEINPNAIGISLGLSTDHDYVRILIERIRIAYTGPIILGGSQASLMHQEILAGLPIERIPVDFVITGRDIGSGEKSTLRLLQALEGNGNFEKVPGIAFKQFGKVIVTKPVCVDESSLHLLEMPRRDLFAKRNGIDIYSFINQSHTGPVDHLPYAVMHTSRGCGGACTFCHTQFGDFNRKLIRRSLANVFAELEYLRSQGVRTISIEDDNFGGFTPAQLDFADEVLEKIKNLNFQGLYFPNGMTIQSMINGNFHLIRKLRELADYGIKIRNSIPAESADNHTLQHIIHKPHSVEDIDQLLKELKDRYLTHEHIDLDVFFMVGVVGYDHKRQEFVREHENSMKVTLELADRTANLGVRVNIWWMKPNPNGPQYKLWRQFNPGAPFSKLQFAFPPGIWGSEEDELKWNGIIIAKNREMKELGVGSRRPIFQIK